MTPAAATAEGAPSLRPILQDHLALLLSVSATQELARILEHMNARIAALETEEKHDGD